MNTGARILSDRLIWQLLHSLWPSLVVLVSLTGLASAILALQPLILAALLSSIMDLSGVSAASEGTRVDLNSVGSRIISWLQGGGVTATWDTVSLLLGTYVVQAACMAVVDFGAALQAHRIKVRSITWLQSNLVRQLLTLDLQFFHRQRAGELVSRLLHDVRGVAQGIGPVISDLFRNGLLMVAYCSYLLYTNVGLTAAAAIVTALHLSLSQVLKRPVRRVAREAQDAHAEHSTTLYESLLSIGVTKAFGSERLEQTKLSTRIARFTEVLWREGRVRLSEAPARTLVDSIGVAALFLIATVQLRAGRMTPEGLLMFVYIGRLIATPANQIATSYVKLQAVSASFHRIRELFREQPLVLDGPVSKLSFDRSIEFRHVGFTYACSSRPALQDVSLVINKGEEIAIVGPSGAGKSTLVNLLLRLHDPAPGTIYMDGIDLRQLQQREYRQLFGVVPQEALLLHSSIRDNIRHGRDELTDDAVERAARRANAHHFISRLPLGYDTLIGDRGVRLSGGERQRVAIARAIANDPAVLILDEATSALDSESERSVQEAVQQFTKHGTAVVIAHRLATVLHADWIAVVAEGRIVDVGPHQELLERCVLYSRLCELQFGDPNEPALAKTMGANFE